MGAIGMKKQDLEIYQDLSHAVHATYKAYISAACTDDGPKISEILDQLHEVMDKYHAKFRESFVEELDT